MATYSLTWAHGVTADSVISFAIEQSEGDFATLEIVCKNPRVPLLSGELWATLARNGTTLFYGRLVGVPEDIQEESVRLLFLARPDTYDADKAALAETLKVAPFWDPVWIAPEERANPDSVLEARPELFHIDRVTHAVTVSNIIAGEAGTVVIDPDTVPYDSLSFTYGEAPADSITCHAEIHWRQKAQGEIDLTSRLMAAFAAAGSVSDGYISTYTGEGLMSSWPKPGRSIGGGWSVANAECLLDENATTVLAIDCATGGFKSDSQPPPSGGLMDLLVRPGFDIVLEGAGDTSGDATYTSTGYMVQVSVFQTMGFSWKQPNYYDDGAADTGGPSVVGFQRWSLYGSLSVKYEADRERIETIDFTMTADVQPIVSSREDANLSVELSSAEVDQPIDAGGALPIGDIRRNSYLVTPRGEQSLSYLVALCRARILARARAARLSFATTLDAGIGLTLRHSATLTDPRLPGGTATGKVVGLSLSLDGESGEAIASVTLACTIGRGGTFSPPDGVGSTYESGVVESGVQSTPGAGVAIGGDVYFLSVTDATITDGSTDLFNLTADAAVESLTVTNGAGEQGFALLDGQSWADTNAAVAALEAIATDVDLILVPVTGDPITTAFAPTVSALIVPKTIDLETV